MNKRFRCIWPVAILLFVSGCGLGSSMMRANHLTYNDAVQFTERQELLLNIVRLRYNEGPEFLATSSISTQFSIDLSATAGAQVGKDQEQRTELLNIGGAVGYSERPTITFTPRNDKEFTQELISPIDLEIIFLLVNYGWDIDRVLRLTSDGINGLRNETLREAPPEYYESDLREFARTVKDLGWLQEQGLVEVSFEPEKIGLSGPISAEKVTLNDILNANKDDYKLEYQESTRTYQLTKVNRHLVLRFSRNVFQQPQFRQIVTRLGLASDVQAYRIVNAPGSQIKASEISKDSRELILSTRSVLGTMAYLCQGVSVPEEHIESGVVSYDKRERATNSIISDLFRVKVQKEKPDHVSLAVPYKGYWFYIEENDISSRRTIGVLDSLMRLKIMAIGAQNVPVLTLPVGR
ncbi:MAG TPA: hypothetical protein VMT53_21540 [Terriglobales bacterium]|nr:hypothetical protein [Terriglobales bacterium]